MLDLVAGADLRHGMRPFASVTNGPRASACAFTKRLVTVRVVSDHLASITMRLLAPNPAQTGIVLC